MEIHSNWFSPGQPLIPQRFLLPSRELTSPTKREVRKIIFKRPFLEDMGQFPGGYPTFVSPRHFLLPCDIS